jgi:hypothetical protein
VLSPDQLVPIVLEYGQQLLILNVPERPSRLVLAKKSQVSEKLTEPYLRGQLTQLSQHGQCFALGWWNHGSRPLSSLFHFGKLAVTLPGRRFRRNRSRSVA